MPSTPTIATATTPWSTNTTLREIADGLRGKRRIVVLTHLKPDGDAVGSTMAVVRALNTPGPWVSAARAEAWYAGPVPPWLRAVAGDTPYRILEAGVQPDVPDVDAVVVLDTGSWTQLQPVREWLSTRAAITSLVDHHVQGDADVAARRFIDPESAAVCQPAALLCQAILNVNAATELPPRVAQALYLGLATDTGWFRHSNVSRRVMVLAGELLDAGADHVSLYQHVEQQETPSRLRLLGRALATLELHEAGTIATMTLTKRDFAECAAQPGESGGFVDHGQSIPSVRVTAVLTEASGAEFGQDAAGTVTKISLRSKPGDGAIDVNAVAKRLGGGGHIRAAGARLAAPLDRAKAELVRLIAEEAARS